MALSIQRVRHPVAETLYEDDRFKVLDRADGARLYLYNAGTDALGEPVWRPIDPYNADSNAFRLLTRLLETDYPRRNR